MEVHISILVIMDKGLKVGYTTNAVADRFISILVIMDKGLKAYQDMKKMQRLRISILVIMDKGLKAVDGNLQTYEVTHFNPCYNG